VTLTDEPPARAAGRITQSQDLPAGEVTFLFSDIEKSTRAWEQHPSAMPAALARHQGIVRGAVAGFGGTVVKDTGDGLFAVFPSARAGVLAAVEAQRGLGSVEWGETGPLRARMGLHTADAEPERGDYHGVPVNRCARIMSVGHGGQILVSEPAYRRIALDLPSGISFLDLGLHRLRDLSVPVQLLQVLHPDLDVDFPPLKTLDVLPNNLPAFPSSLVGRTGELVELAELLGRTRLLTMTGAGGVGKTRLALQLAADEADRFHDGVWLVDLAGLSEPDLVPQAVASALQISDQPGRSWIDSVLWFLRERQTLIVFDNCEHLLGPVASLVERVLERCPGVKVVATSREALHTPGEVAWVVPSLGLPGGAEVSDAERLFLLRAAEADPHYQPTGADLDAVAQICRRLDGLPLAIELAAARVRVLSATEIAERLDDRFRLLTGGVRTSMPRQRTLEAAVAWSYDLLEEPQRRLFERLSVFAGGFTLAAAERVCAGDPIDAADVLDLLTTLVDRSLVVYDDPGPPSRYRLLETMRAYGRDRLMRSAELQSLRDSHLAWIGEMVHTAAASLEGPEQSRWLRLVSTELDNIRAALSWSLSGGDITNGLVIASSLYRYWYIRAVREGKHWLDRLLAEATDAPPKVLAKASYALGSLTEFSGDPEGACRRHEKALAIYRDLGRRHGEAWALHGLGVAEWGRVDVDLNKAHFEQALAIFRELEDPIGIAFTLQFLILWEVSYGDGHRAAEHLAEDERLVELIGMPLLLAHHAEFAALVAGKVAGDAEMAADHLHTALESYRSIDSVFCAFHGLESVAYWAVLNGHPEATARLLGAVDKLRAESGTPPLPHEHLFYVESCAVARSVLGDDRYDEVRRSGSTLTLGAAIDEADAVLGH
jgi:predicted ATPase/class 3 adenylate cyclase